MPENSILPNEYVSVEPTPDMLKYADLAKKVARRSFGIDIEVKFAEWPGVAAQYINRTLILNLKVVPKEFFESLSIALLDLTIHELAHEAGDHTQHAYHQACTHLGANLTIIALKESEFFGLEMSRLDI